MKVPVSEVLNPICDFNSLVQFLHASKDDISNTAIMRVVKPFNQRFISKCNEPRICTIIPNSMVEVASTNFFLLEASFVFFNCVRNNENSNEAIRSFMQANFL